MKNTILFVDGENFVYKIEQALLKSHVKKEDCDISTMNFEKLLHGALKDFPITQKIFYTAKLHRHPETEEKSKELIKIQRKLHNTLKKYHFEVRVAGNVRGQIVQVDNKSKIIFKEKGVDVQLAVDLVSMAADKLIDTAILCSSDSDLQPAVKEAKKRGVELVYLGFEFQPNKGLTFTTNRTILLRNSEIKEALNTHRNEAGKRV
ncbi:NYN domain-containing protein [Candidatus Roizmanbacteria bacterium]|nr:NYN domain-containing protein [Candidatus Roizmanbacteria bacterium]